MTKRLFMLLVAAIPALTLAQNEEEIGNDERAKSFIEDSKKKTGVSADSARWSKGGTFGINANQASYSNWQAGGVNSIAVNNILDVFANYTDGEKWDWNNRLTLSYGIALQDTLFSKTDDRIELNSRVDRIINEKWSGSGFLNFRTQFAPGFANPGETEDTLRISNFMAPGYLMTGLGLTYRPSPKFTAVISPVTSKMTFVMDERLANQAAFGVDTGSQFRYEIGGYLNVMYATPLGKNIKLQSRLDVYANYIDIDYTIPDFNAEVILFMKVNDYINANITLNMVYDNDVKFDTDDNPDTPGEDRLQLKEVLAVGFTYNFGDKK